MLKTSEDTDKYISCSKVNIDNYIHKNQYRKAFWLLILFLERLDGEEKTQVIDYYSILFSLNNEHLPKAIT